MNIIHQLLAFLMVWFILAGIFHLVWMINHYINRPDVFGYVRSLVVAFMGTLFAVLFILAGVKGLWILFR